MTSLDQSAPSDDHSPPPAMASDRALASFAGILVDWDGCLAIGNIPREEALFFLARHQAQIAIVSNNSTHLPEDFSNSLRAKGIAIPAERIILAGAEAVSVVSNRRPRTRTLMLGSVKLMQLAKRLSVDLVRSDPDLVLLLRDTRFSYRKLERVANAVAKGAELVVANTDASHPGPRDAIVPETGALLAAIGRCVDLSKTTVEIVGKPSPPLFLKGCQALGLAPADVVMIGDNPDTDIAGARALGMATLLIDAQFKFEAPTQMDASSPPPSPGPRGAGEFRG